MLYLIRIDDKPDIRLIAKSETIADTTFMALIGLGYSPRMDKITEGELPKTGYNLLS